MGTKWYLRVVFTPSNKKLPSKKHPVIKLGEKDIAQHCSISIKEQRKHCESTLDDSPLPYTNYEQMMRSNFTSTRWRSKQSSSQFGSSKIHESCSMSLCSSLLRNCEMPLSCSLVPIYRVGSHGIGGCNLCPPMMRPLHGCPKKSLLHLLKSSITGLKAHEPIRFSIHHINSLYFLVYTLQF